MELLMALGCRARARGVERPRWAAGGAEEKLRTEKQF